MRPLLLMILTLGPFYEQIYAQEDCLEIHYNMEGTADNQVNNMNDGVL